MTRSLLHRLVLAGGLAVVSAHASAQTQAEQSRADQLAEFFTIATMCETLGMKLEGDFVARAHRAVKAETSAWTMPEAGDRIMAEALIRQGAIFKTDLNAASDAARTDKQLREVKSVLLRYGRRCVVAASDRTFSELIHQPPGYNVDAAATSVADAMLEAGGLASWQTPEIQARGDLMMLAGICRSKIGPARSDALVSEYGTTEDARARSYFLHAFDEGLANSTTIETLADCNRAIDKSRLKTRPAPVNK